MNVGDRARQLGLFDSGWELETADDSYERLMAYGAGVEIPPDTTRE